MEIESNTGRYRALSRKSIERMLNRTSDAIVVHLRYAGSDVGTGGSNGHMTDEHETPSEL